MREDPNFVHPALSKNVSANAQLGDGSVGEKRGREDDNWNSRSAKRDKPDEEDEMEIENEDDDGKPMAENGHTGEMAVNYPSASIIMLI